MEEKIGKLIRDYRKKNNLTSAKLAEEVGVSQGTISQIETGKRLPTNAQFNKMANILSISKEEIAQISGVDELYKPAVSSEMIIDMYNTKLSLQASGEPLDSEDPEGKLVFNFEAPLIMESFKEFVRTYQKEFMEIVNTNIKSEIDKLNNRYHNDNE